MKTRISGNKASKYLLILFAVPALLNFLVFRYLPIFWALRTSFYDYSLLAGFRGFIGFGNYGTMFQDSAFHQSMGVTLKYFLYYVPSVVILALILGMFVSLPKPGVGFLRAIIFIPVVTSFVVVSIVWGMLLNKDVGMVNAILQNLGLPRVPFLMNTKTALPTVALISVWKNVGYSMIIIVAGLKGVDKSLYESAYLDGASSLRIYWSITLPMISRQLMFITIWATLQAFQSFVPIQTLTGGGPNKATNVIVYHIYNIGFNFGRMGYAISMSIVLLVILLLVSIIQMRMFKRDY
ncbi:Lactose transport system permease protein LacF [bioreactor metagenome]|uniref:Lactose transport system permease protein LacF n=1 Tax=bioreactor metagenome TaxID=1076179 RepID=A0A644WE73_9ZZZZ|nr:sugar ABC transporter permease [Sphaerochaeta sp.]